MAIVKSTGEEKYVTYLEPDKLKEFRHSCILTHLGSSGLGTKPISAWWGSPIDANFGWKEWCESEDFGDYDFNNPIYWKLEEGCKVFQIDWEDVQLNKSNTLLKYVKFKDWREEDLKDMPIEAKINTLESSYDDPTIDFVKMLDDGIVAVELLDSCIGHSFINNLEISFNSWDCESIVVLDSKYIKWRDNETN